MATKKFSLAALSLAFIFAACGDDNSSANTEQSISDSEDISVSVDEVSGVTQKGPFLMGSKVQMFEISNGRSLNQTGKSFNGKISNDKGEFKIKGSKLASQYVILEASGYYRNEITGNNSNSELTLLAISNVSDRNTINVNLLTHLEYERVNYLVTEQNLKVDEAKKQAQKEILDIFYIDNTDFSNSEDLNIAGASDEDGALLAISVLLQGDHSESQLSELLTKIAIDMEEDGEWNDEAKKNAIADWAAETVLSGRIATIRSNVEKWLLSSIVPNFEKHINNFWRTNYGLGTCDEKREGEVLQNSNAQSATNGEYFICADGSWRKATDIEKDTYKWLETLKQSKDGDSKYGDVIKTNCYVYEDKVWRSGNETDCSLELRGCTALRQDTVGKGSDKVWHICDAKSWRDATTYEKDTFGWKDSTDGATKKGNVTDSIYVFDKTAWRATSNVEAKLGGCVSAIADSIGKVDGTYYICKSNEWVDASTIEYDTYRWAAGKDGDSKSGSVNTSNCYVYENKTWRSGNASDCSLRLRGCTTLRQDTVGKGSDDVWYKCDSQTWRTATDIEKDTATWGAGKFNGEIRSGQINKSIYYIYEVNIKNWRNARTLEKDSYDYKNNKAWADGIDGEIKKGSVTDTIYVFDKTAWRMADDIERVLGGCVAAIQDSVGKAGNTYYICNLRNWALATERQYDLYKHECSEFGQIVHGNVNADYAYFCYGEEWKRFYGNESISYGKLVDARDGRIYRTVKIGNQTWMAENLNYNDPQLFNNHHIWCMSDPDSCEKYGRYYSYGIYGVTDCKCDYYYDDICRCDDRICYYDNNDEMKIQSICPNGWHLPNINEWNELSKFSNKDAKLLQMTGFENWNEAVDQFGFGAIPAGEHALDWNYGLRNQNVACFISYPETNFCVGAGSLSESKACSMSDNSALGDRSSVRCIKDEE